MGYLSLTFLEAKFGAPTRISEANFGTKPLRPPYLEVSHWDGHAITGDLSIFPDLITKGPEYREQCNVDWGKSVSFYVKLLTTMHHNELKEKW